jgi:type III secretion system YopN/LcrE/InvE/MxiC family regulator
MAIQSMGPRLTGMRAPEESLGEKLNRAAETPDDEATPAATLGRFVQNSDEMAASLRPQFRRRADVGDKLEGPGEHFERVLEEDAVPRAQQLQAMAGDARRSLQWLLQQARQQFPDESDLALVLRDLLQRKELPQITRQRLEALLHQVQTQASPKRLKAGINCALKARLFGSKLALRASLLRASYRAFLDGEQDPGSCYEEWIALFGHPHRTDVLDFIEAALLSDIDSLDPSCSRLEFGNLLARLGDLKALRSAELLFIQHLLGDALITRHNREVADWLVFLLGLLRWPDELSQLLDGVFGEGLVMVSPRDRGALLQVTRRVCAALPAMLFEDEQAPIRIQLQFDALTDIVIGKETIEQHAALSQGDSRTQEEG